MVFVDFVIVSLAPIPAVTVAILAQGTHWAVAVTQAFLPRFDSGCPLAALKPDVLNVQKLGERPATRPFRMGGEAMNKCMAFWPRLPDRRL